VLGLSFRQITQNVPLNQKVEKLLFDPLTRSITTIPGLDLDEHPLYRDFQELHHTDLLS
tara:strand:+ start:536 stop:712 length:177 start_codon:yes stop_codon:yes gene_type:complete